MLDRPAPSQRDRLDMYNANALKLGLFGANCSSGRSATRVPERWSASWEDCLALAKMGDEAGIDFMLPIGRWKGYGGDSDLHGESLETITWATGLLAATSRITCFGTVHAPLFHPIIAAKQCVTADHIGEGRFGLNIVAGWNEGEFEMFGVQQREHEARYAYAQEWVDAIKMAWAEGDDFRLRRRAHQAEEDPRQAEALRRHPAADHECRLLRRRRGLRACATAMPSSPPPRPRARASMHTKAMVEDVKQKARAFGREIEVFTVGQIVCRATQKEADDYYHYAVIEMADWGSVERMMEIKNLTPQTLGDKVFEEKRQYFASRAIGGYPFVGTPDRVADELAALSRGGIRGIAFSMINYLDELPFFRDEVLPRLERLGVREPARS